MIRLVLATCVVEVPLSFSGAGHQHLYSSFPGGSEPASQALPSAYNFSTSDP
jgi:hypothetical protein